MVVRLPEKVRFSTREAKFRRARHKSYTNVLVPGILELGDAASIPAEWDRAHHMVAYVYCLAGLWLQGPFVGRNFRILGGATISRWSEHGGPQMPLARACANWIEKRLGLDEPYFVLIVPEQGGPNFLVHAAMVTPDENVRDDLLAALGSVDESIPDEVVAESHITSFVTGPGKDLDRQMCGGIAASRCVLDLAQRLYEEDRQVIANVKQARDERETRLVA
jgi:hypothetical protein